MRIRIQILVNIANFLRKVALSVVLVCNIIVSTMVNSCAMYLFFIQGSHIDSQAVQLQIDAKVSKVFIVL